MSRSLCIASLFAVVWLAGPLAWAEEAPAAAPAEDRKVIAILGFSANEGAKDHAPAVETLVATRVAQEPAVKVVSQDDVATLLDVERQKALLGGGESSGCDEDSCFAALAGAVGARYVVKGRADRFGDGYVLAATVYDSQQQRSLAKLAVDAADDAALPDAARALAIKVLQTVEVHGTPVTGTTAAPAAGTVSASGAAPPASGNFSLGLKVGNAFLHNIASLNLSGDLELGYRFDPEWVGFLQVGVSILRTSDVLPEDVTILPSVLGARHLYRVDSAFQPYWGLGLGVQLAIADKFGIFQDTGPLPTVLGFLGFHYFVTEDLMLGIEGSSNLAQATLGLTGSGRLGGFNLDLNGTVGWRF